MKAIPKFTIDEEKITQDSDEVIEKVKIEKIDILKRQEVNLDDFALQKARKIVKNRSVFATVSISTFQLIM